MIHKSIYKSKIPISLTLALFVIGICYGGSWVFSPGNVLVRTIAGIQLVAIITGLFSLIRWAVMVEKENCQYSTRGSGFWYCVSVAMSLVIAATSILRGLVPSSAGLALGVVTGIQIVVVCVAIFSLFRWAALYEKEKNSRAPR